MSEATAITFEKGYRRLQVIAEEVNSNEVPVDRMAELFAEGRGLDKALTDHLAAQKARIEKIESGEEIQAFQIVGEGQAAEAGQPPPPVADVPADTSDFDGARQSGSNEDDIPF